MDVERLRHLISEGGKMNLPEISEIKATLLSMRSEILNKANEFKSEQSVQIHTGDEADAASLNISSHISIRLQEHGRVSLLLIDRALGKISNGTYGKCETCGEMISLKRLKARLFTNLCIDCQEEQESFKSLIQ